MSDSAHEENGAPGDDFGLSAVRELLRLISETDVTEITIERGESKLQIRRGVHPPSSQTIVVPPSLASAVTSLSHGPLPPIAPFHPPPAAPGGEIASPAAQPAPDGAVLSGKEQYITAPMVGTYYSAPSPKDPDFVKEGDTIHTGEVVGIVEAMKIMNEIESELTGRIVRIMVTNGQPVEYGQQLMAVEPS